MQKLLFIVAIIGGSIAILMGLALWKGGDSSVAEVDLMVAAADWTAGNADAVATLVEYGDFQCPACAAWEPHMQALREEYGDRIRFVYRHFPLSQHQHAELTAYAAEAAGAQGRFWEMHDKVYDTQSEWAGSASSDVREKLLGFARDFGLDMAKFGEDMDSDAVHDAVRADFESGFRAGVDSTPTFFIGDRKIQPRSPDELRNLLDAALAS